MAYPISDVTRRIVYTGSAGTGPYSFSFEVLANTDIEVYKNTTLLTLTTDYSVTINANGTGSVTLVSAATGSDNITLVGARAIERTTDFVTGGDLFANTLNDEFDSLVIFAQQVDEKAGRGLKAPITDPTDVNMTLPVKASRKGKVLAFDETTGDPVNGPALDSMTTVIAQSANINTVADSIADVNTVAADIADVSTVAGVSGNVTTVAGSIANVNTVANDLNEPVSEIDTVATNITNVNNVGNSITNVNTVATNISAVNTNATNITAIQNAASNAASAASSASSASTSASNAATSESNALTYKNAANTSASNAATSETNAASSASSASSSASTASTQASNAASSASSASTSASNAATSASNAATSASTASTQATNAATSATNALASETASAASAVSAAASAASAAATLDNFDDRYLGPKTADPGLDNDGNALVTGALYFNTTDNVMKIFTASGWIAASAASVATLKTFEFVATAGQTVFSGADANGESLSFTDPALMVTLNGVRLRPGDDYTTSAGTSITLVSAAALNDEMVVDAFGNFLIANVYTKAESDALVDDLSGVTNASTARTNLGLGALAIKNTISTTDIDDASVTAAKLAAGAAVPSQTGQSGKYLTTDGTTASWGTVASFAAGTAMLFVQTAAPTGWTKSTTHNDKALRVVSGTASTGGSVAFTTAFAGGLSAGSTTLSTSQMPAHTHTTFPVAYCSGPATFSISLVGGPSYYSSGSTGGGGSHNHTLPSFAVSYVDVIIATKD